MLTVASHPPASDLTCSAEPAALTLAEIDADTFGLLDRKFTVDALLAGRSCRDALKRICEWHKARGLVIDCTKPLDLQSSPSADK